MIAIVLLNANLRPQKVIMVLATRRSGNDNGRQLVTSLSIPSFGGVSQNNGVGD